MKKGSKYHPWKLTYSLEHWWLEDEHVTCPFLKGHFFFQKKHMWVFRFPKVLKWFPFWLKFTWLVDPVFDDCPWQPRCLLSMSQMNPFSILAFHQRVKTCPSRIWKVATNLPTMIQHDICTTSCLQVPGTQDEHQVYQTWWMKGAEANDLLAMCIFYQDPKVGSLAT